MVVVVWFIVVVPLAVGVAGVWLVVVVVWFVVVVELAVGISGKYDVV